MGPKRASSLQALSKDQSEGLFAELGLAPSRTPVAWEPSPLLPWQMTRPLLILQQLAVAPAILCQPGSRTPALYERLNSAEDGFRVSM